MYKALYNQLYSFTLGISNHNYTPPISCRCTPRTLAVAAVLLVEGAEIPTLRNAWAATKGELAMGAPPWKTQLKTSCFLRPTTKRSSGKIMITSDKIYEERLYISTFHNDFTWWKTEQMKCNQWYEESNSFTSDSFEHWNPNQALQSTWRLANPIW